MGTLLRWAGAAGIAALFIFACGGGGGSSGTNPDAGPGDDQPSDSGPGADASSGDGSAETGPPKLQCGGAQALFDAPDAGDYALGAPIGFGSAGSKFLVSFLTSSYYLRARGYDGSKEGSMLFPLGADGSPNSAMWGNDPLNLLLMQVSASGKGFIQFGGFDGSNTVIVRIPADAAGGTTSTLTKVVSSDPGQHDLVALPNDEALSAYLVGTTVHVDHFANGTWTTLPFTATLQRYSAASQLVFAVNPQGKGALILDMGETPTNRVVLVPVDGATLGTPFDWVSGFARTSGLQLIAHAAPNGDVVAELGSDIVRHIAGTTDIGVREQIPVMHGRPFIVDDADTVTFGMGAGTQTVRKTKTDPWQTISFPSGYGGTGRPVTPAIDSKGNVYMPAIHGPSEDLYVARFPRNANVFEDPVSANFRTADISPYAASVFVDANDRVIVVASYPNPGGQRPGLAYVVCQ